ncbi:hypothetical protein ACFWR5_36980, partial [Streptomyces sp. NPDC058613]
MTDTTPWRPASGPPAGSGPTRVPGTPDFAAGPAGGPDPLLPALRRTRAAGGPRTAAVAVQS